MTRPRKPLLSIKTKPPEEIEAERLKALVEKHRRARKPEPQDG